MALSDIEVVRLLVGDNARNTQFYPILTDEEYDYFVSSASNLREAARMAAISIAMILAQKSTREVYGDVEVWNEVSKQYRAVINDFIKDITYIGALDAMPWSGGLEYENALIALDLSCGCDGSATYYPYTRKDWSLF